MQLNTKIVPLPTQGFLLLFEFYWLLNENKINRAISLSNDDVICVMM